jgi:photosystem II stability/assembly factor-like uncharacterized protein
MRIVVLLIAALVLLSACGSPEPHTGPSNGQMDAGEFPPTITPQLLVDDQGYPVPQAFQDAYPAFQPPAETTTADAFAPDYAPQRPRPVRTIPCPYDPTPTPVSTEYAAQSTAHALMPTPTVDLAAYPEPVPTPECPTPVLNPPGMEAATVITPTLIVDPNLIANPAPSAATRTPSRWITFFDADNGVGVSDEPGKLTLLRTTNGGQSWQQVNMPPAECVGSGMQFVDPQHGWSAGQAVSGTSHGPKQLCRTTDGGMTWTKIHTLEQFGYGVILSFVNPQLGYLMGVGGLVKTEDGGETFEEIEIVSLPASLQMMDFLSENKGWGVGNDQLLQTSDGGKTWGTIPLAYRVKWVDVISDDHAWVRAEDCDGRNCQPILLSTADDGRTWTRYAINDPEFNIALHNGTLSVADKQRGWVRLGTRLWSTTDGGRTWTRLR